MCVCVLVYACTLRWCMYSIMHTRVCMCTCFVCVGLWRGPELSAWHMAGACVSQTSQLPSFSFFLSPVGAALPILTWVFPILFLAIFFCLLTYSSKPKWSLFRSLFKTTIYKTSSSSWHLLSGMFLVLGPCPLGAQSLAVLPLSSFIAFPSPRCTSVFCRPGPPAALDVKEPSCFTSTGRALRQPS